MIQPELVDIISTKIQDKKLLKKYAERYYYLISRINYETLNNTNNNPYCPLLAVVLRDALGRTKNRHTDGLPLYKKIINDLKNWGIIETKNYFVNLKAGKKQGEGICTRYAIARAYRYRYTKPYVVTDKHISNVILNAINHKFSPQIEAQKNNILSLQIDLQKAVSILETKYNTTLYDYISNKQDQALQIDRDKTKEKKFKGFQTQFKLINQIAEGKTRISRNKNTKRVYHSLCNLLTELRQSCYLPSTSTSERLIQIDCINSQPFLLNYLVKEYYQCKDTTGAEYKDLRAYEHDSRTGQLYEALAAKAYKLSGNPAYQLSDNNRKEIKGKMYSGVLFLPHYEDSTSFFQKAFKELYPSVFRALKHYKLSGKWKDGGRNLSLKLQEAEARIWIDSISKIVHDKGMYFFTIHDSIIVNESDVDEVKKIIKEVYSRQGLTPALSSSVFSENQPSESNEIISAGYKIDLNNSAATAIKLEETWDNNYDLSKVEDSTEHVETTPKDYNQTEYDEYDSFPDFTFNKNDTDPVDNKPSTEATTQPETEEVYRNEPSPQVSIEPSTEAIPEPEIDGNNNIDYSDYDYLVDEMKLFDLLEDYVHEHDTELYNLIINRLEDYPNHVPVNNKELELLYDIIIDEQIMNLDGSQMDLLEVKITDQVEYYDYIIDTQTMFQIFKNINKKCNNNPPKRDIWEKILERGEEQNVNLKVTDEEYYFLIKCQKYCEMENILEIKEYLHTSIEYETGEAL